MSTLTTYNQYIKTASGDHKADTVLQDWPANFDAIDARTAKWNRAGIAAPTPNDDVNTYYSIFSLWFYDSKIYMCTDASSAAAVWIQIYPQQGTRIRREEPSGALDGNNLEFGLDHSPVAGSDEVFVNGRLMTYTDDYTLSGATITFTSGWASTLISGCKIRVSYDY